MAVTKTNASSSNSNDDDDDDSNSTGIGLRNSIVTSQQNTFKCVYLCTVYVLFALSLILVVFLLCDAYHAYVHTHIGFAYYAQDIRFRIRQFWWTTSNMYKYVNVSGTRVCVDITPLWLCIWLCAFCFLICFVLFCVCCFFCASSFISLHCTILLRLAPFHLCCHRLFYIGCRAHARWRTEYFIWHFLNIEV